MRLGEKRTIGKKGELKMKRKNSKINKKAKKGNKKEPGFFEQLSNAFPIDRTKYEPSDAPSHDEIMKRLLAAFDEDTDQLKGSGEEAKK